MKIRAWLRGWLLPLAIIIVWEGVARLELVSSYLLPAFSTVCSYLYASWLDGTLMHHLTASGVRVFTGFAVGALLGLGLGLVVGLNTMLESLIDPSVQALRSVPALAWVPLLLLWMGMDESPKVTLIALGAFFPVYINVISGVRSVDPNWIELGRLYALSRTAMIRRILLPASVGSVFAGLRTGLGVAWLYVVAAELIAAESGLGFLLSDGRELSRADMIFASILLLASAGKISDGLLKGLERRLLPRRASAVRISTTEQSAPCRIALSSR